jgi:hypothetical protein
MKAAALSRLLERTNGSRLEELYLSGCDLTADHVTILASASGSQELRSLTLNDDLGADEARRLFSSEHLRSLVRLDVYGMRLGSAGAIALASAMGWDRLRSLDIEGTHLDRNALLALLASPNLQRLVWLTLGMPGYPEEPFLDFTPDIATALTRLPHLASLQVTVPDCDPQSKQILSESDSVAWPAVHCYDTESKQTRRASCAPDRLPPLDPEVQGQVLGMEWE